MATVFSCALAFVALAAISANFVYNAPLNSTAPATQLLDRLPIVRKAAQKFNSGNCSFDASLGGVKCTLRFQHFYVGSAQKTGTVRVYFAKAAAAVKTNNTDRSGEAGRQRFVVDVSNTSSATGFSTLTDVTISSLREKLQSMADKHGKRGVVFYRFSILNALFGQSKNQTKPTTLELQVVTDHLLPENEHERAEGWKAWINVSLAYGRHDMKNNVTLYEIDNVAFLANHNNSIITPTTAVNVPSDDGTTNEEEFRGLLSMMGSVIASPVTIPLRMGAKIGQTVVDGVANAANSVGAMVAAPIVIPLKIGANIGQSVVEGMATAAHNVGFGVIMAADQLQAAYENMFNVPAGEDADVTEPDVTENE